MITTETTGTHNQAPLYLRIKSKFREQPSGLLFKPNERHVEACIDMFDWVGYGKELEETLWFDLPCRASRKSLDELLDNKKLLSLLETIAECKDAQNAIQDVKDLLLAYPFELVTIHNAEDWFELGKFNEERTEWTFGNTKITSETTDFDITEICESVGDRLNQVEGEKQFLVGIRSECNEKDS